MPKKRSNFKQFQGSSTGHIAGSGQHAAKHGEPAQSVNALLSSLRIANPSDAAAKKREFAELSGQRSVPPELRGILGQRDVAPPETRAGARARERLRTPGPATPGSWTRARLPTLVVRGKAGRRKSAKSERERPKPDHLDRFVSLIAGMRTPEERRGTHSLNWTALRRIAERWSMLDEDDYPALQEFSLRMRLALLAQIVCYGPPLTLSGLKAMTDGDDTVETLDLAGLIGHGTLTLSRLAKLLSSTDRTSQDLNDTAIESWDASEPIDTIHPETIRASPFCSLTQLCLSHPPSSILWRDLLALTKQTPKLTHLSLAYWPRPTLTPNLVTTTVTPRTGMEVHAGGSHFYSDLDHDLAAPASLLRLLSHNLLQLRWLDLEGCTPWLPALAIMPSPARHGFDDDNQAYSSFTDSNARALNMTLLSSWSKLTYINARQGWLPTYAGLSALPLQQGVSANRVFIGEILAKLPFSVTHSHDQADIEKRKAQAWLEGEWSMIRALRRINDMRDLGNVSKVVFDLGWTTKMR
ncbi:hypothetical protein B0A48_17744 [Cryoendolithus antarcticus]|uniref:Uncharacterized protein n=1 Tax=Cryoendolithus antarcticus TaxID=1507870 RepID=A0A1V8SA75_9PEZI|nr:hypothetical protein B0A48_17744 [Cryoendolithus antarcticus]